jgi:hypothetical protein
LQALRHGFEQGITDRMPQRVVDGLEQIQVEDEDRISDASALVTLESFVSFLAKQHAV